MESPLRPLKRLSGTWSSGLVELDDWRRRLATLVSAVLIGLLAIAFAEAGDLAQRAFAR